MPETPLGYLQANINVAGRIVSVVSGQTSVVQIEVLSRPASFRIPMYAAKGPTPGAVAIPTSGKLIYFDQLTTPGLCLFKNFEAAGGNYYEYGIFDPQTSVFYPLGECKPGECWPLYLSRNLQEQYSGSGTGTTGPENYLMCKANGATVQGSVEAYER